ncbi:Proline dehydrogenase [Phytophthora infestans]|uniref:Proline dehydrogenase n=1 Tax=Phytophthora infestans TaxID=4787 RepID=A0A833W1Z8_PHYIN|nr:Proline dehydrogenase [Phytophthora infestans]KAF4144818.1 Proline dehydrogenase [Phytophthora infestans]
MLRQATARLPKPAAAMARSSLKRSAAAALSSSASPRPSSTAPTAAVSPIAAHDHSTLDQSKQTSLADEFHDTERIFATKTTPELVRAYGVYFMSQFRPLVQHSGDLLEISYKFPGAKFTDTLLRATFFGHFCAGEDVNEIRPVIRKLETAGIGAILDFAAEADVEQPRDLNGVDQNLVSARTYAYDGEAACDANAAISRHAIIDASEAASTGEPAFVAIKCTALGKPELLMRMSAIIVQAQLLFHTLDGPNLSRAKSRYLDCMIDYPTLSAGLRNAGVDATEEEIQKLFNELDQSSGDGVIDYVDWVSFLDPFDLTMGPLTQFIEEEPLSDKEKTQLRNMIARLESLANDAAERGVKLMVDAEQTYMQPAIDHLTLNLQRKYNRDGADVIYNTFQCYLKMSSDRIDIDLERARREKFRFAAKLVRGAYMVQERKRARDKGYADPIHDSIEDTHTNYNAQVTKLLHNNNLASFMVASHNEQSVVNTVQQMQDIGISRATGGVYFGQLLGMCDHVSYTLGANAYKVFKYVPYGPIHEVLPYLIRRAQENSGLMSGAQLEMRMLSTEIKRRMFGRV